MRYVKENIICAKFLYAKLNDLVFSNDEMKNLDIHVELLVKKANQLRRLFLYFDMIIGI